MFITLVSTKRVLFIAIALVLLSLWQLKVSIDLIMRKLKVCLYFCLTADMTKCLQKCSLSTPLPNI